MSNKLTLSDIYQVIDSHIENQIQFMFVVNRDLAELICEYVADNYDLYDEEMQLSDKYKDYYVSLYYDGDEVSFYCESARGYNGEYKWSDAMENRVDYFICNDMSEEEADDKLLGYMCTWSWIDVDWEEDDNVAESSLCKCCECKNSDSCDEYECTCKDMVEENELCQCDECRKERFYHLLTDTLNCILEAEGCPECTLELLLEDYFIRR